MVWPIGSAVRLRLVDVKTTALGKYCSFVVTSNEVCCSEDMAEKYQLFRVFDFAKTPGVYILTGSLRDNCVLEARIYRAAF